MWVILFLLVLPVSLLAQEEYVKINDKKFKIQETVIREEVYDIDELNRRLEELDARRADLIEKINEAKKIGVEKEIAP